MVYHWKIFHIYTVSPGILTIRTNVRTIIAFACTLKAAGVNNLFMHLTNCL